MNETTKVTQPLKEKTANKEFAIFEHRGQQYEVKVGDVIEMPLDQKVAVGKAIIFEKVLVCNQKIGTPYAKGCKVYGTCLEKDKKSKKIIVFKYKSKKNYRVKSGFRARYNQIRIDKLEG